MYTYHWCNRDSSTCEGHSSLPQLASGPLAFRVMAIGETRFKRIPIRTKSERKLVVNQDENKRLGTARDKAESKERAVQTALGLSVATVTREPTDTNEPMPGLNFMAKK